MNKLKKSLNERTLTIGSWIQTGNPVVAEILAEAGYDWIALDCEHSSIGIEAFAEAARGIYGRNDTVTLARVRENDVLAIRQVLDMGAQGVIVPLVNNAEDAKKAVRAAKYPPMGLRGFGFCRANKWGTEFDEYAKSANGEISVIVMIESKEAVDNIDEILDVEGVDGVFIGPYDMSGSYGCVGKTNDPIIVEACKKVALACKKHNKVAGRHIVIPTKENISEALEDGFTFIALGADIVFVDQAARDAIRYIRD